jgi:pyruvate dehydrogenase E2 component (dihydrolipoamide acetyltransferase)
MIRRPGVAKDVIMPALGMAQETGTLMRWLKAAGESVAKGEPLMEVETDKATVEVEAPASGILAGVTVQPGDTVPVGQRIALILAPGEAAPSDHAAVAPGPRPSIPAAPVPTSIPAPKVVAVSATPTAARMAAEHQLDLAQIRPRGGRVQKEDVLSYLAAQSPAGRRTLASPKARRLAQERGLDLRAIRGSGPDGAVLAADVLAARAAPAETEVRQEEPAPTVSRLWHVMAERVSQAWTSIPHFYLLREANAARLIAWRDEAQERFAAQQPADAAQAAKITYTDLLVKVVAAALRRHPRLNVSWQNDTLIQHPDVNIGLAVAVEDGLVVPVLHGADTLGLAQLAERRVQLVARAQAGRLAPADLSGGTFTISNLGMYGVDAFNAIVNPPQAAILAVGRIAERVVPLDGQPAVRPMLALSLSCDHRAVDGARGAQFLQTVADLIEHPMRLLD